MSAHAVTADTFAAEVLHATPPVLVDFWSDWCPPCKAIAPLLDQLAVELDGRLKVVKIDASAATAVATAHGVSALPTLLVFQGGKVVARKVGATSLAGLRQLVSSVV